MTKTNTPLLSLGSRGTIGNTLTTQKRHHDTIVRTKPVPAYRHTLPQAYQRWLYKDYAYLWRQQTASTRQEYASAGSRHHLTAFQYWMKYHLTHLPDIAGWWKLDDNLGATTTDSSRNQNTGTIVGASPATGLINGCLSFDGLNDLVDVPDNPTLKPDQITIEVWWQPDTIVGYRGIIGKGDLGTPGGGYTIRQTGNQMLTYLFDGAGNRILLAPVPIIYLVAGTGYHTILTADGTTAILYVAGIQRFSVACIGLTHKAVNLHIGHLPLIGNWASGLIDQVIIYNRALDPTEATRHSLRRYPL